MTRHRARVGTMLAAFTLVLGAPASADEAPMRGWNTGASAALEHRPRAAHEKGRASIVLSTRGCRVPTPRASSSASAPGRSESVPDAGGVSYGRQFTAKPDARPKRTRAPESAGHQSTAGVRRCARGHRSPRRRRAHRDVGGASRSGPRLAPGGAMGEGAGLGELHPGLVRDRRRARAGSAARLGAGAAAVCGDSRAPPGHGPRDCPGGASRCDARRGRRPSGAHHRDPGTRAPVPRERRSSHPHARPPGARVPPHRETALAHDTDGRRRALRTHSSARRLSRRRRAAGRHGPAPGGACPPSFVAGVPGAPRSPALL